VAEYYAADSGDTALYLGFWGDAASVHLIGKLSAVSAFLSPTARQTTSPSSKCWRPALRTYNVKSEELIVDYELLRVSLVKAARNLDQAPESGDVGGNWFR